MPGQEIIPLPSGSLVPSPPGGGKGILALAPRAILALAQVWLAVETAGQGNIAWAIVKRLVVDSVVKWIEGDPESVPEGPEIEDWLKKRDLTAPFTARFSHGLGAAEAARRIQGWLQRAPQERAAERVEQLAYGWDSPTRVMLVGSFGGGKIGPVTVPSIYRFSAVIDIDDQFVTVTATPPGRLTAPLIKSAWQYKIQQALMGPGIPLPSAKSPEAARKTATPSGDSGGDIGMIALLAVGLWWASRGRGR